MKFAVTLLFVGLVCTAVFAQNVKSGGGKTRGGGKGAQKGGNEAKPTPNPKICIGPLKDSKDCCNNVPNILSMDNLLACDQLFPRPTGHPKKAGRVKRHPPGGPGSGMPPHMSNLNSPCVVDCAMNKSNLLNADGSINADAVISNANLQDPWKASVENVIRECATNVSNIDKSKFPTPKPESNRPICKMDALLFVACVNRSMYINCPEINKPTDATIIEKCSKTTTALAACDISYIPTREEMEQMKKMKFASILKKMSGKGNGNGKSVKRAGGPKNKASKSKKPAPESQNTGGQDVNPAPKDEMMKP